MHPALVTFFGAAVAFRLISLAVSRRNERTLRAAGAEEFGAGNTVVLASLHAACYIGAFAEGLWRRPALDGLTTAGVALYAIGMLVLWMVVRRLGRLWTVKLYLAPDHTLDRSWLFRVVRHPNYLLNVLPELIGLVLALRAWIVLGTLFPAYLVSLGVRVAQEERIMRRRFPSFRGTRAP